jgi:2-polyprenyl-3-methyl-5-hydroxy-6-metoxy-1,4-benzoquinol methylase
MAIDTRWQSVKALHGAERLTLGPSASYQWRHDRKHLLFVLARYKHAARLIGDAADVLEVGCGEGIGAGILAEGRLAYHGIDPDQGAIAEAKRINPYPNVLFGPGTAVDLADSLDYDAVIALDVIEHVQPAETDAFLADCARLLHADGTCLIGTPNATAEAHQSEASRLGHVNLMTAAHLTATLERYFRRVILLGMNDETLHSGYAPMCHYLIGVGIGPRKEHTDG